LYQPIPYNVDEERCNNYVKSTTTADARSQRPLLLTTIVAAMGLSQALKMVQLARVLQRCVLHRG
jgi:hypothetical protein